MSVPIVLAQIGALEIVLMVLVVAAAGFGAWAFLQYSKFKKAHGEAAAIIEGARQEADKRIKEAEIEARDKTLKARDQFQKETEATRQELKSIERRLEKREDSLTEQAELLVRKEKTIESIERRLNEREREIEAAKAESDAILAKEMEQLRQISGMNREQACELFLKRVSEEMEQEEADIIKAVVERANEEAATQARNILVQSIQRLASEITMESTVASVDIPNDEMKGRVIGREGRNIRAFEKATGVDVIVDDTPGVVIVSGHDSVRREIGRRAMAKLILDGRIHPARIEEIAAETRKEVEAEMQEAGRQAIMDMKIRGVNNKIIPLLGRLRFRTSYGQNVLEHAIEVAHLSGMIAEQLGLDARVARRAGLLHDIGKAVDHEVEGGHPEIGADLLRRYGEATEVVEAAACHHDLKPASNIYAWVVSAADAVSASRPGARRESLERYIQRLEKLESIAMQFKDKGVESAYAIQAGRELRVIIEADKADDAMATKLARDIAKQIETELTFPGEIRVTAIREKRAVEYARYVS